MTSPTDNQTASACPRDNLSNEADDARSAVTGSASEKSRNVSDTDDADAAWEAEVDRIAEPAISLEDTLRAILDEIADGVS